MPAFHINARETDLSLRFPEEQKGVRNKFFPKKSVEHLSNNIVKWKRGNILRIDDMDMSTGDEELPTVLELELDTDDSYTCSIIGARVRAKEITSKNADPAVDWDVERPILLKQRQDTLLEHRAVRGTLRNATLLGDSYEKLANAERFDGGAAAGCKPVDKLSSIVLGIKTLNGGYSPNAATCSSFTLNAIRLSEQYKDLSKYTRVVKSGAVDPENENGAARVLEELIGLALGSLDTTDYIYNAAKAGLDESDKQIIGSSFIIGYTAPPTRRTQGLGARMVFNGVSSDEMAVIMVPQYDGGLIPGEEARGFSILQYKLYNTNAVYCLDNCVNTSDAKYGGFLDSTT